ncbi:hypothetical protein [Butyrivibrio sp. WCE2006]
MLSRILGEVFHELSASQASPLDEVLSNLVDHVEQGTISDKKCRENA